MFTETCTTLMVVCLLAPDLSVGSVNLVMDTRKHIEKETFSRQVA